MNQNIARTEDATTEIIGFGQLDGKRAPKAATSGRSGRKDVLAAEQEREADREAAYGSNPPHCAD